MQAWQGETLAITAVVSLFVFIPLVVAGTLITMLWLSKRAQTARRRMVHQEIEKAIEKGATPQEIEALMKVLDDQAPAPKGYISRMGSGIAFLAWGVGLAGFFLINGTISVALLLGIPLVAIGVFKVLTAKHTENPSRNKGES